MIRRTRSIPALIVLITSSALTSADQDTKPDAKVGVKSIDVVAGRELIVRPADQGPYEAHIPVRVVPSEVFDSLSLRTVAVVLNGRLLDPGLVQVQTGGKNARREVLLKTDLSKLAEAGTYTIKIEASLADANLPALPLLDLTLTRPNAELQVLAPIRLERVAALPGCGWWHPTTISLSERSGKSSVTPVAKQWLCELRGDGGRPAGRILFALPACLKYGTQADITVASSEAPALGKSTGTLVVRSPQLANEVYEVSVEVTNRVWWPWLVVTIGLGIWTGYVLRTRYEERRRHLQARVTAAERLQALDAAIGKAGDATLQRDLQAMRDALQAAIDQADATPTSLDAAAQIAEAGSTARLRQAADKEASLRSQLASLRADLGLEINQPPRIVAILQEAGTTLASIQTQLNEGNLTDAEASLSPFRATIVGKLQNVFALWKTEIDRALERLGAWPEARLPAVTDTIQRLLTEVASKNELQTILPLSAQVHVQLETPLLHGAIVNIVTQARDVHSSLGRLPDGQLAGVLAEFDATLARVEAARATASSEHLDELVEQIHQLREMVCSSLLASIPRRVDSTPGDPLPGLNEGKFAVALQAVWDRRRAAEREAATVARQGGFEGGEIMEALTPMDALGSPQRTEPNPIHTVHRTDRGAWDIALDAPRATIVGRPIVLRARFTTAPGTVMPATAVRWYINGIPMKEDAVKPLEYTLFVPTPSAVEVRVEANTTDGQHRETALTLQVAAPAASDLLRDLRGRLKQAEKWQTFFSGLLITLVGFLLYRGLFIGDLGDFGAAFFWGFSTDIGVARLRELSAPLFTRFTAPTAGTAGT